MVAALTVPDTKHGFANLYTTLLNRPSCPSDDPVGQGTEQNCPESKVQHLLSVEGIPEQNQISVKAKYTAESESVS